MTLKPVDNPSRANPKRHYSTPKASLRSDTQRNYPTELLNYLELKYLETLRAHANRGTN
jgi:hypothetical protein